MQTNAELVEDEGSSPSTQEERFAEFYRRNYWLVLAYAERRINNHETARDLTSDTFRVAWGKFGETEHMGLSFLYQTCRNLLGNEYRRQFRVAALEAKLRQHPEHPAGENHAVHLREAMLKMRGAEREVLYLTYWEEQTAQQLAEILGCTPEAAWARVSRARKSLKHILRSEVHHA